MQEEPFIAPQGVRANRLQLPAKRRAYRHVDFDVGYRSDVMALMQRVKEVVAYPDTLELFFRGSAIPKLGQLRKALHAAEEGRGKPPRFKAVKMFVDGQHIPIGYRFIVNRPSEQALLILDKIVAEHRATVYRADIALDFITRSPAIARILMLHLIRHGVMRWCQSNGMPDEEFGTYWSRWRGKRKTPTRNLLVYADRLSKPRAQPCCHLELRVITSEACQRQGIEVPSDLIGLKPLQLFKRNFVLMGDCTAALKRIQDRVPDRIVKHLSQDYRAQLLNKFFGLRVNRIGLEALRLPKRISF